MSSEASKEISHYQKHTPDRLSQGDILQDVEFGIGHYEDGNAKVARQKHPYVVVLTQDCDLLQDVVARAASAGGGNHDKVLRFVLVAPAYLSEEFKVGKHLAELELRMTAHGRDQWKLIRQQGNKRYHFLPEGKEVPELVVDFKHFYTVGREHLVQSLGKSYVTSVNELFRESLSQRFANYLSRIALPELPEIMAVAAGEATAGEAATGTPRTPPAL